MEKCKFGSSHVCTNISKQGLRAKASLYSPELRASSKCKFNDV